MKESEEFSEKDREQLWQALQKIADDPSLAEGDERLKTLVAKINRKARKESRKAEAQTVQQSDEEKRAASILYQTNDEFKARDQSSLPSAQDESTRTLQKGQTCYCCKANYHELHFFYHALCPSCADLNFANRTAQCDLTGRTALLTGGRIKIGFEVALLLLRSGAKVILTTRFPVDAHERFAAVEDASEWLDRLTIHGLDLRNLPALQSFIDEMLVTLTTLDIIINNAAQTIKRPLAFYQDLLDKESTPYLLEGTADHLPTVGHAHFPVGQYDLHQQQVDLRPENSWSQRLHEVTPEELLEVQLVNITAPFMLNSQLKTLMEKSPHERRFIVNVSAMEGNFSRATKTHFHPHTNMAKAALNMMTRTSAADYARDGIYMTSVDTGWITDENPSGKRERLREQGFVPPLDIVDGAARVFNPVVKGVSETAEPDHGVFLKDYAVYPW